MQTHSLPARLNSVKKPNTAREQNWLRSCLSAMLSERGVAAQNGVRAMVSPSYDRDGLHRIAASMPGAFRGLYRTVFTVSVASIVCEIARQPV
jgi:hypothetical protein